MSRNGLSERAIRAEAERNAPHLEKMARNYNLIDIDQRRVFSDPESSRPPASSESIVRFITTMVDPDELGKNTKWILQRIIARDAFLFPIAGENMWHEERSRLTRLTNSLSRLQDIKRHISVDRRDLNNYRNIDELMSFLDMVHEMDVRSIRQMDRQYGEDLITSDQAAILLDDDKCRLLWIKTVEAANYFGRGTMWCLTTKNGMSFDTYARSSNIFFVIWKSTNIKWAYCEYHDASYREFRDQKNQHLDMKLFEEHPDVMAAIQTTIADTRKKLGMSDVAQHTMYRDIDGSLRYTPNQFQVNEMLADARRALDEILFSNLHPFDRAQTESSIRSAMDNLGFDAAVETLDDHTVNVLINPRQTFCWDIQILNSPRIVGI